MERSGGMRDRPEAFQHRLASALFHSSYSPQLQCEYPPLFKQVGTQLLHLLLGSGQPHPCALASIDPYPGGSCYSWQASNATLTWCLAVSIPSRTVVLKSSCLPCGRKEENSGTLLHKLNHTGHKGPAVGVLGIKFHQLTKPIFWESHLLEPRFRAPKNYVLKCYPGYWNALHQILWEIKKYTICSIPGG